MSTSSNCGTCHGTGKVACKHCQGKKKLKCKKCNGYGSFSNCNQCGSTGKMTCPQCGGSGKTVCPVCDHGKVWKKRQVRCLDCHGTGVQSNGKACKECGGSGRVTEKYWDYCPTCHGSYKGKGGACSGCGGTGKVTCTSCHGTGEAVCLECGGKGAIECEHCKGTGQEQCPECHKREVEAERRAWEKRCREEKEAKKKEERAQTRLGCGCLTVIIALVCLVIWGPDWFAGNVAGDILGKIRGVSWDLIMLVWIFVSGIAKLMWQHWIISGIIILLFLVYGIK